MWNSKKIDQKNITKSRRQANLQIFLHQICLSFHLQYIVMIICFDQQYEYQGDHTKKLKDFVL